MNDQRAVVSGRALVQSCILVAVMLLGNHADASRLRRLAVG
jgi:hypothetical protein